MNEKPMEWMTDCGEGMGHKLGRFASLAGAILMFFYYAFSSMILVLIVAALLGGLCAWMWMHAFIEYEFCYFDGEMDVAAIFNRARRKKKMTIRMDDVEYMVKKIEPGQNTVYFCRKEENGNIYTLSVNAGGKRTAVVMVAIPEFVKVIEMKHKLR